MLEPGCYGEIKNIRQAPSDRPPPSNKNSTPQRTPTKQPTRGRGRPKTTKTTNRGNALNPPKVRGSNRSRSNSGEKPRTLQESRDLKYGLQTSRPVRENRRKIDYCKLNDGLEERVASSPSSKRRRKSPLPARSGPSNTRISAQSSPPPKPSPKKDNGSTKLLGAHTLIGATTGDGALELVGGTDVTPKSTDHQGDPAHQNTTTESGSGSYGTDSSTPLVGPLSNDDELPDLVLNHPSWEKTDIAALDSHIQNTTLTDAATTEDEEDAAEALLRLGDDMNLGPIDDNSTLMPIGGTGEGVAKDAVPVPIEFSEKDVQEAVRNMGTNTIADDNNNTVNEENVSNPVRSPLNNLDVPENNNSPVKTPPTSLRKGKLELKEYGIKKKAENEKLRFKCVQCPMRFKTCKESNKHYVDTHQPLLCEKCKKVFKTPASLSLHQYDHEELRYVCKRCGKGFHFKGQLTQHNVDHRSTRTFQCMHSGCGCWFK